MILVTTIFVIFYRVWTRNCVMPLNFWNGPRPLLSKKKPFLLFLKVWNWFTQFHAGGANIFLCAGRDVIGLAETGSGKTGAFTLPMLHALLSNPQRLFCLILTPTRELAFQISEQVEALGMIKNLCWISTCCWPFNLILGSSIGVKCAVIVGGMEMMTQSLTLAKKPHVVIATPGRLVDHLENTKGFNLKSLKFLIMDEADRILNMDFETEVDKILKSIPRERRTLLFSATMTSKVQKLQRASLVNPVRVQVSSKYQTVEKLLEYYAFIPLKLKGND